MTEPEFVVIGEALVDIAADGTARPGGSPYNVAIGLARLDRHVGFGGRLSGDSYGRLLREHALESGVDLSWCPAAAEPTTTARVTLRDGIADYAFGVDGTADFAWTADELSRLPSAGVVHFGSLTSWMPASEGVVTERVRAYRAAGALISYDPNVRPDLQPDPAHAREQVERAVALADVVKASSDDLAYVYPGTRSDDIARAWRALGPRLVVVTNGADGAVAHLATQRVHRPTRPIEMVDTVGAGDAFTSGLLDALVELDLIGSSPDLTASPGKIGRPRGKADRLGELGSDALADLLDHAALVAALTCAKPGADPPRRAELTA